jgi:hypothetical protein
MELPCRGPLVLAFLALSCAPAEAETVVVTQQANYILGDNDSPSQARRLCVEEAERLALAQTSTLVESRTNTTTNEREGDVPSRTAKQDVQSYSAAIVGADVVSSIFEAGSPLRVNCVVKVRYDPDNVTTQLQSREKDQDLKSKVAAQQSQIDALNRRLSEISVSNAAPASVNQAPPAAYIPPPPPLRYTAYAYVTYAPPPTRRPLIAYTPVTYAAPMPVRAFQYMYARPFQQVLAIIAGGRR